MRLGVPFMAPRGLGAVEVPFGRHWLPFVFGCTGLSSGAPDNQCATTNELPDWLPSFSGWAPDYAVTHRTCSVTLPDCCYTNVADTDRVADRWRGRRSNARPVHIRLSDDFLPASLGVFPRTISWASRPG
jgi:hypothetical protein